MQQKPHMIAGDFWSEERDAYRDSHGDQPEEAAEVQVMHVAHQHLHEVGTRVG